MELEADGHVDGSNGYFFLRGFYNRRNCVAMKNRKRLVFSKRRRLIGLHVTIGFCGDGYDALCIARASMIDHETNAACLSVTRHNDDPNDEIPQRL